MHGSKTIWLSLLFASFVLYNCSGSSHLIQPVKETKATYQAGPDESLVVFMRPSSFGFAIQSVVFEVTKADEKLIGVVPAKKKVVYHTTPGRHLFMVYGENADFMKADLKAGKVYYALVNPRMGMWKARFSLGAIHYNIDPEKFQEWTGSCSLVENSPDAFKWAKEHAKNIHNDRVRYLKKWNQKTEDKKPALHPEDGF